MALSVREAIEKMKGLQKESPSELLGFFEELLGEDVQTALDSVNDSSCPFPVFFLLIPNIKAAIPREDLSARNLIALSLYESRLSGRTPGNLNSGPPFRETLMWMLSSGRESDGMSDLYDELLDAAAISLILIFKDASAARDAMKLCFERNRKGTFNHDLVWALFRSYSLDSLSGAAEYILSPDEKDVGFACRLLYLKPPRDPRDEAEKKALHDAYLGWLYENSEYMYFTGDSFQRTSEPVFSVLNASAKYIGKPVSKETGIPLGGVTLHEQTVMALFERSDDGEKARLLSYSEKLRKNDPASWTGFLSLPFEKQRSAAHGGTEGIV
jgi:hypothetical protein